MTITVSMRPDAPARPASTREVHEMWIALAVEGFRVVSVDDHLAVQVEVDAPSEDDAVELVRDAYGRGLPLSP
jgi:hypothetical protein